MAHKHRRSLETLVGKQTYAVWAKMLHCLVPDGRTHRLAPLVAGMLQYAATVAYEQYGDNPEEGTVAHSLFVASEAYDSDQAAELLFDMIQQLFHDAKVTYKRVNSQGEEYSIADSIIEEFIHWYDMPWESY